MARQDDSSLRQSGNSAFADETFAERLARAGLYDTEEEVVKNFDFLVRDVQHYLKRKGWTKVGPCVDYLLDVKKDERRDDGSPSSLHELTQVIWDICCLEDGLTLKADPQLFLALSCFHDILIEDADDENLEVSEKIDLFKTKMGFSEDEAKQLFEDCYVISKTFGKRAPMEKWGTTHEYFSSMNDHLNVVLAKLVDKIHNLSTLVGSKSAEKIASTILETMNVMNDFVAGAQKQFPEQEKILGKLGRVVEKTARISNYAVSDTGKPLPDDGEIKKNMPKKLSMSKLPGGLHPLIVAANRSRKALEPGFEHPRPRSSDFLSSFPSFDDREPA